MIKTQSLVSLQYFPSGIRHVGGLLLVAVVCGLMGRSLAGEPPAPKKVATVEGITEYQFDNGLRLLLFPDNSQSKVSVNMTVLVGSRQEGYGETGMAHLLEHMVFKGTPTHTNIHCAPCWLSDLGMLVCVGVPLKTMCSSRCAMPVSP